MTGTLERRCLEEPLNELPVREAVIHSQDMELGLCNRHRHCRRNSYVFVCDEGEGGCYEEKASLVEERQVVCVLGMRWLLPLLF
jgi:hypothetical protein